MDIDARIRALISKGISDKKMTQAELSRQLGKSPAWLSKVLSGKITQIPDSTAKDIEQALEVTLLKIVRIDGEITPTAANIAKAIETSERVADMVDLILDLYPVYSDSDLETIGYEIIDIVRRFESDPKEVGRSVVNLIRN